MVSPSGGVSLRYEETDTAPLCVVSFPASRITSSDKLDSRFVQIDFIGGAYTKTHWHDDRSGPEAIGYSSVESNIEPWPILDTWAVGDDCPNPSFYLVYGSTWIPSLPKMFHSHQHFLIDGRDGCVEVAAERYTWQEWQWDSGRTLQDVLCDPPVAHGDQTA